MNRKATMAVNSDEENFKLLMEDINKLELNFYEKEDGFWRTMFLGLVGYVSLMTPLVVTKDISRGIKVLIGTSILLAIVGVASMIPVMHRNVRRYGELLDNGKKYMKQSCGQTAPAECNPKGWTKSEKFGLGFAILCGIGASIMLVLVLLCNL